MNAENPTTTTRAAGAPTLPELRQVLAASLQAYPELRRGLTQALRQVDAAQGEPERERGRQRHNRRRVEGLR